MKRTYFCPQCSGVLNPGTKIILRGQHGAAKGLVLLSPKPGNYEVVLPDGFKPRRKDRVEFACPLCGCDLSTRREAKFAEVAFRSGDRKGMVVFSKVYGEHSTYFVTDKSVKRYGEHATDESVNFFGAGPED